MATPIEISEEAGVRYLHFGSRWIQGAMRVARPHALELGYTRDMMLALLLRDAPRWPRHVLKIGLGAGSIAKFLLRHCPNSRLTVVEIEESVVRAARQYFRVPDDDPPRFVVQVGDGHDTVMRSEDAFDLVVVDGFDAAGRAGPLETAPFYAQVRRALTDAGILVANLLGRRATHRRALDDLRQAFDGRVATLRTDSDNVIAYAGSGEPAEIAFAELRRRALDLRAATGLNVLPGVARLAPPGRGRGGCLRI